MWRIKEKSEEGARRLDKSAPAFAFLRQGGEYSATLASARRTLIAKADRFSPLDETVTRTLDPSHLQASQHHGESMLREL
jgi:hypothetical protein